jgi:hypothetical protein
VKAYPQFRSSYSHEEMVEHFLLTAGRVATGAHVPRRREPLQEHFSEQVPIEGVVTPRWKEKVFEQVNGETKINRRYYELCVLEKLERALKCKEVWVEGSYDFRNPSEDLPSDWSDEQRRTLHYQALGKPLDAQAFVQLLRTRMEAAITNFNRVLPELNHLRIFRPRQNDDRGLWALAKLERQPEPQSLGVIKEKIGSRYGMLDLLDVFVEADRLVDFTRFFTHSGTREVRSREALRPLLILDLFGEATNMGIKQVANANDRYRYDELLYVRKTYFSPEALRNANGAVVNKLLALRNPRLWGEGASSCASDGSRFEIDVTGVASMYALQLASGKPSALVDWNNNYGDDPNKCVVFHCGNWAKSFFGEVKMANAEILATTLGTENTYGTVAGRTPKGPFSYSRITTDDRHGVIRSYVGDGQFVDDPLDTFGSRAVVEVDDLQGLMRYVCRQGFEHHAAMNQSHSAAVLHEAFSNYFGWETYLHQTHLPVASSSLGRR